MRKPVFRTSADQVRNKLGSMTKEDSWRSVAKNKCADQLCGYRATDCDLCFIVTYTKSTFSHDAAHTLLVCLCLIVNTGIPEKSILKTIIVTRSKSLCALFPQSRKFCG